MYRIRKYRRRNGQIPFDNWMKSLKDIKVKTRILKRLDKVQLGNLGDWKALGGGVYELREHFHQGFRVYYGMEKRTVILLLCGGNKTSQDRDISLARQYWHEYQTRASR